MLGLISLVAALISVHYGLGFLLGTGEAVANLGIRGILYAVSCGLGLIGLSLVVPFYLEDRRPIWILLGKVYGRKIENWVKFLSWFWMLGVVASQILGAALILSVFKIPLFWGMVITSFLIALLSILSLQKISKFFLIFLIISSLALLLNLFVFRGLDIIFPSMVDFPRAIFKINNVFYNLGIFLPTLLVTILGMDFWQFVVQSRDKKTAVLGSLLAGLILIFVAFLPSSIVLNAQRLGIAKGQEAGAIIPFMLLCTEKKIFPMLGGVLVLGLYVAALGSGSGVNRILIKTLDDFSLKFFPRNLGLYSFLNSFVCFILALVGKSIISLIVSFYSIYVASVFFPFISLIISRHFKKTFFDKGTINVSIIIGFGASTIIFILGKSGIFYFLNQNLEFWMITCGLWLSGLALIPNLFKNVKKLAKTLFL